MEVVEVEDADLELSELVLFIRFIELYDRG